MPAMVRGPPRHAHARDFRQRASRRISGGGREIMQHCRLPIGGVVDRSQSLPFQFDGKGYEGYAGDTLASALLANGVHLVARSFKYHRPRGIFAAGSEEPNALVELKRGARSEPNMRATTVELYEGLVAASQNRWPSLVLDMGSVGGVFSRLLPA